MSCQIIEKQKLRNNRLRKALQELKPPDGPDNEDSDDYTP